MIYLIINWKLTFKKIIFVIKIKDCNNSKREFIIEILANQFTMEIISTVPELRSRYSKLDRYTKLRWQAWQVKQARTANKNGRYSRAAHLL